MSSEANASSSSSSDMDTKLVAVVTSIHSKIPPEKKLTVPVLLQLLNGRFQAQFPGVDFTSKTSLLASTLAKLQQQQLADKQRSTAATSAAAKDDDAAEQSSSDDESFNEEDEESGEDEEEDSDDSSEFSGDDSSSSSSHSNETPGDEPVAKKARIDSAAAASDISNMTPSERVEGMLFCTGKLGYRPRKRNTDESIEEYLNSYLVPYFESKQLDPTKFGAEDIKRYKIKKEVADLLADGGSLTLDKNSRRGRAFVTPPPPPQQSTTVVRPSFLDEEE